MSPKTTTSKTSTKSTSSKSTSKKETNQPTENVENPKQTEQEQPETRQFEFHPKYGTEQYIKQRRPLAFLSENALKKMKYATMLLLAHKYDSGNIFIRYGYFEYYDQEKKKIYFTLVHPWGTGASGILKNDQRALLREYYEYLPELDLNQSFYVNE